MARPDDPLWEELGNIDYLLDQLARAVERAEVHRDSYDLIAQRQLARRADIIQILEARGLLAAKERVSPATAAPPQTVGSGQRQREVPWPTILTVTGAFLVIVASAIFAVATWDLFGVAFRLVFLGSLTVAFFAAGFLVRSRLKLAAGGVALVAVGSAMLLFDGWIAIDGYKLEGPWPWVAWLAVCWTVYWAVEVALGGRFFGIVGAASQIAWLWLLGQGLGWETEPRMAAIALVGLAWALTSRAAETQEPYVSLARVLKWSSPIVIAGAAVGVMVGAGLDAPPFVADAEVVGWTHIASAIVVGVSATIAVDRIGLPGGLAAVLHVPAFAAVGLAMEASGVGWGHVAVLFAMAAGYALWEIIRGGWGHGVIALVAELIAWLALASKLDLTEQATLALVATVAASWILAAHIIRRTLGREEAPPSMLGFTSVKFVAEGGGWAVLAISTLTTMPFLTAQSLLPVQPIDVQDVALFAYFTVLWLGLAQLRREPAAMLVAMVASLYAAAGALMWLAPEVHSAVAASVATVVLLVWLALRGWVHSSVRLPTWIFAGILRSLSAFVLVVGLGAGGSWPVERAWETSLLLGVGSMFWLVDSFVAEESRAGLAVASSLATLAISTLVSWSGSRFDGAVAGAAVGLAAVAVSAWAREKREWSLFWAGGAAIAATVVCPGALGRPGQLAIALALAAASWVVVAWMRRVPEVSLAAGVLGFLALFSTMSFFEVGAWATVACALVVGFALLGFSVSKKRGSPTVGSPSWRWAIASAGAGAIGVDFLAVVGWVSWGVPGELAGWADLGGHGFAVALTALGGYVIAAGALFDRKNATYAGVFLVLVAYWVEAATLDANLVEYFTTPLGAYLIWFGYRWATQAPGRRVPLATDTAAMLVAVGIPTLLAADPVPDRGPWTHLAWATALAVAAIAAGVLLRVRAYFFGGTVAIVLVGFVRSFMYLAEYWWLVLGVLGTIMLVVALTWERQRMAIAETGRRFRDSLVGWR